MESSVASIDLEHPVDKQRGRRERQRKEVERKSEAVSNKQIMHQMIYPHKHRNQVTNIVPRMYIGLLHMISPTYVQSTCI
jgi:hypothetical protein